MTNFSVDATIRNLKIPNLVLSILWGRYHQVYMKKEQNTHLKIQLNVNVSVQKHLRIGSN